jgi:hypothetical protein
MAVNFQPQVQVKKPTFQGQPQAATKVNLAQQADTVSFGAKIPKVDPGKVRGLVQQLLDKPIVKKVIDFIKKLNPIKWVKAALSKLSGKGKEVAEAAKKVAS